MAQISSDKADQLDLLQELKRHLRQEVLAEVMKTGLTDSIISEYRELAGSGVRLLTLLERYGFTKLLNDEDRKEFDDIMKGLSVSGLRCQLFLAVTPSDSIRTN